MSSEYLQLPNLVHTRRPSGRVGGGDVFAGTRAECTLPPFSPPPPQSRRLTRLKKRVFCSTVIGFTSAWLPSLRSLLSHLGAAVIWRDGHVRSGMFMGVKGLWWRMVGLDGALRIRGLGCRATSDHSLRTSNSPVLLRRVLEHRHGVAGRGDSLPSQAMDCVCVWVGGWVWC